MNVLQFKPKPKSTATLPVTTTIARLVQVTMAVAYLENDTEVTEELLAIVTNAIRQRQEVVTVSSQSVLQYAHYLNSETEAFTNMNYLMLTIGTRGQQ